MYCKRRLNAFSTSFSFFNLHLYYIPKARKVNEEIAVQIHLAEVSFVRQTRIFSGNIREKGKPFFLPCMPEHQKVWIPGE
jgi:hypothetical protein